MCSEPYFASSKILGAPIALALSPVSAFVSHWIAILTCCSSIRQSLRSFWSRRRIICLLELLGAPADLAVSPPQRPVISGRQSILPRRRDPAALPSWTQKQASAPIRDGVPVTDEING